MAKNKIIKLPAVDDVDLLPTTEQYQLQNEETDWGSTRITRRGEINYNTVVVTDDYTAKENDRVILVNQAADPKQVTLPTPKAEGKIYTVKMLTANNVTIQGNGANIDGAGSIGMTNQYEWRTLIYASGSWHVISSY